MKLKLTETIPWLCVHRPNDVYEYYGIYEEYSEIPISEINRVISTLPDITDGLDPADGAIIEEVELRQSYNLRQLQKVLDSMKKLSSGEQ